MIKREWSRLWAVTISREGIKCHFRFRDRGLSKDLRESLGSLGANCAILWLVGEGRMTALWVRDASGNVQASAPPTPATKACPNCGSTAKYGVQKMSPLRPLVRWRQPIAATRPQPTRQMRSRSRKTSPQ